MSKKDFFTDYILSIFLELAVLFGLIFFCAAFIDKGQFVCEQKMIGSEMCSPTLGRLIYLFLSFALAITFGALSSFFARKSNDLPSFWFAFSAGILLWQSVGEEAWHFSVGNINFVQLESIASFPLVILFIGLLIYGCKFKSFDFGIFCVLISFACNWLGHYITVGIYPFFERLTDAHTWNVLAGSIGGGIVFILSIIFLIKNSDSRRGRLLASVMTYISIGIAALSIIDG